MTTTVLFVNGFSLTLSRDSEIPFGYARTRTIALVTHARDEDLMPIGDAFPDETALGSRLRAEREARRLSLKSVEDASDGTITASMLSSYERGEHSITARRLCLLARLYDLPIEELLEPIDDHRTPIERGLRRDKEPIRLDVHKLAHAPGREAKALFQLVQVVEERRRRRTPDWIELRHEDLITVAATLGRTVDALVETLRRFDLLRHPQGRPSLGA